MLSVADISKYNIAIQISFDFHHTDLLNICFRDILMNLSDVQSLDTSTANQLIDFLSELLCNKLIGQQ